MDIFRLRPITSHVRVKLSCDNYRQGKFGKFIKSKFKILTCVVLLGRLNTMRGIWEGEIYISINDISIVSASYSPVTFKTTTNFSDIYFIFSFKICFDRIFEVEIFLRASFQQQMQLWPGCFFKVYATHFLMWPPLWYNSKLAKSIPLF